MAHTRSWVLSPAYRKRKKKRKKAQRKFPAEEGMREGMEETGKTGKQPMDQRPTVDVAVTHTLQT